MNEKEAFINAVLHEIEIRKKYLSEPVDTIYFGGGTPSVLSAAEINLIVETIKKHFVVNAQLECTLEANPDDLTKEYLTQLKTTSVNRLSIGIQSFDEKRLQWMNRSHTSAQAKQCVMDACNAGFNNISIDLIFALPEMTLNEWNVQLQQAVQLPVTHLSCYSLTVEDKTLLANRVKKKQETVLDDEDAQQQFLFADAFLESNGFAHYEISNYAQNGFSSKHNSSYWENKPYVGLGPSAHSYNLHARQWNVSSSKMYINAINKSSIPATTEELTTVQAYNEYVMISLRTARGVSTNYIADNFGDIYATYFISSAQKFISQRQMVLIENTFTIDKKYWFAADSFIAELFYTEK